MHKLAFIGPEIIHSALQNMVDDWDLQSPMPTLEAFEDDIHKEEDEAKISKDETLTVIMFSQLFNTDSAKFAEMVAYLAPYSAVCVLLQESDNSKRGIIEKTIKNAQVKMAQEDPSYNSSTPFYFCRYAFPQEDIFSAIEDYSKSTVVAEETREAVGAMLPSVDIQLVEEYEDDDPDAIVIPAAGPNARGQVIAVTSSKGGSGKSTVSITLASYIAKASIEAAKKGDVSAPLKVCVVDLDVRDGQVGFFAGQFRPNIMDIMALGEPTIENVKKGIISWDKFGCDLLLAVKHPRNATSISPGYYANVIQTLRSLYDVIILDTSVNYLDPLLERVAYPIADKILFVSDMSVASIFGCTRWIKETTESSDPDALRVPKDKIAIIINKAMKEVNMSNEKIQVATKGLKVLAMIPHAASIITYATNTGEIGQIINKKGINLSFKRIAEAVVDEPLGNLPYID